MIYGLIIFTGSIIARITGLFNRKTAKFFKLRQGEIKRISDFFLSRGNSNEKVIWFHAASAGEFEQAKPVLEYLKKKHTDILITASFFSPSGYDSALKYNDIDFCFNLPLDYKKNVRKILNCINPDIIIFSKYDVWRNLTIEANKRGVKLVLISATLPGKSRRYKFPARYFFSGAYTSLERIYAISEEDAQRFKRISKNNNILVSGDTRFDRVKTVVERSGQNAAVLSKENGSLYFVAGSTYKISEKLLLSTLKRLYSMDEIRGLLKMILVPHEINGNNINRLKEMIRSYGFMPILFSESSVPVPVPDKSILVVDKFGLLALLYKEAEIVFIGGSFKGSVHSVLEPAVFGRPIITGPYIDNSYEAIKMSESGGLAVCSNREELFNVLLRFCSDPEYRKAAADKSKNYFESNSGAAEYIVKDIDRLLIDPD